MGSALIGLNGQGINLSKYKLTGGAFPPAGYNIDYLIIGGGGGGGGTPQVGGGGAGGGGGGILTGTFSSSGVSSVVLTVGSYGAGGSANLVYPFTDALPGSNGSNSTLAYSGTTLIAYGGGGGGSGAGGEKGGNGGSGGGGGDSSFTAEGLGGTAVSGQGNNGNSALNDPFNVGEWGGSGGGAGSPAPTNPWDGWPAKTNIINGYSVVAGAGGAGFNIAGLYALGNPGFGSTTKGSGGAAGDANGTGVGSNGVAGICYISMLTSKYTGIVTGSPNVYIQGAYTVLQFASSGTYTP